jgi:hypothetical protein
LADNEASKDRPLEIAFVVDVALWVVEYLILKLFPRATFATGQGMKRHQFFTYVRNGMLGAFVLSVVASVLANWLTYHL